MKRFLLLFLSLLPFTLQAAPGFEPYFPWNWSSTNTYFQNGNVGIGTSSPLYPLHVSGAALIAPSATNATYFGTNGLTVSNAVERVTVTGGIISSTSAVSAILLDINGNGLSGTTVAKIGATKPIYYLANDPYIGLNGYYDSGNFKYGAGSSANYAGMIGFATGSGLLRFQTTASAGNADATATMGTGVSINKNGYVGINTVNQLVALAVNGGVHIGGDSDPGDNNLAVDGTADFGGAVTLSNSIVLATSAAVPASPAAGFVTLYACTNGSGKIICAAKFSDGSTNVFATQP